MNRTPGRRGFTLIELLFTMAVIFLIMGLLLGGIRHVMKYVKGTGDLAALSSLRQGITQFDSINGFVPALVKDGISPISTTGPLNPPAGPGVQVPVVYVVSNPADQNFLRYGNSTGAPAQSPAFGAMDARFSLYSLSYYVVGALDVDGVAGPGSRGVKRDGSFEKSGKTYGAFFDPKGTAAAIVDTLPGYGRTELRDARGVGIRYYRWKQGRPYGNNIEVRNKADMNVPWILGDPDNNPELKNADYAIVCAGPNGVFGDEDLLPGPGSPPSGHPQYMTADEMRTKLGRPGSGALTNDDRAAAMADNIIVVGVESHR